MKLIELLELAASGKKFRGHNWDKNDYCYYDKEWDKFINRAGQVYSVSFTDPSVYEAYEEPKSKVKLYKYAHRVSGDVNTWKDSDYFYKCDADFLNGFAREVTEYVKIESSMIEVDKD